MVSIAIPRSDWRPTLPVRRVQPALRPLRDSVHRLPISIMVRLATLAEGGVGGRLYSFISIYT